MLIITEETIEQFETLPVLLANNRIYRDRAINQRIAFLKDGGCKRFIIVNPSLLYNVTEKQLAETSVMDSSFTVSTSKMGQLLGAKSFYTLKDVDEAALICSQIKAVCEIYSNNSTPPAVKHWIHRELIHNPKQMGEWKIFGINNPLYTLITPDEPLFTDETALPVPLKDVVPITYYIDGLKYQTANVFHHIGHAAVAYRELINAELEKLPENRRFVAVARIDEE